MPGTQDGLYFWMSYSLLRTADITTNRGCNKQTIHLGNISTFIFFDYLTGHATNNAYDASTWQTSHLVAAEQVLPRPCLLSGVGGWRRDKSPWPWSLKESGSLTRVFTFIPRVPFQITPPPADHAATYAGGGLCPCNAHTRSWRSTSLVAAYWSKKDAQLSPLYHHLFQYTHSLTLLSSKKKRKEKKRKEKRKKEKKEKKKKKTRGK